MITCGEDGTVRVWDYSKETKINSLVAKMQFSSRLRVVNCNRTSNLIAIGSEAGVVRILEAHNPRRPTLIFKRRLHSKPVTSIKFDPSGRVLATGGLDGHVCLLDATTARFELTGVVVLPGPITGMSWNVGAANECQLFISVDHDRGDVFRIVPPITPSESLVLKNKVLRLLCFLFFFLSLLRSKNINTQLNTGNSKELAENELGPSGNLHRSQLSGSEETTLFLHDRGQKTEAVQHAGENW